MTLNQKIKVLWDASQMLNEEIGEYWQTLCDLEPRIFDAGSVDFLAAWEQEIDEQFEFLMESGEFDDILENLDV